MPERDRPTGDPRGRPATTTLRERAIEATAGPLAPLGPLASVALVLVAALALREAASLLVPILFGLFLALVAWPLVGALERRGAGHLLALSGAIGTVLLVVAIATGILALSVAEMVVLVPRYEDRLRTVISDVRGLLSGFGISADPETLPGILTPGTLASVARSTASAISSAAAALFILAFTLVYALIGAPGLEARARTALGDRHAALEGVERFGADLRRYLLVRAQLGLFAGVLTLALLAVVGVPLPVLWAFLIFAAAFVPNVGTIVGLVPPTLLALLDGGPVSAGAVLAGVLLINLAQDYLLQPRMMGTELNLAPLVVFLSIAVWAWVLGPAGALLAVPLTVGLVAILEAHPSSRPIALLLRNEVDEPPGLAEVAPGA